MWEEKAKNFTKEFKLDKKILKGILIFWGCIFASGVGDLITIVGNMDSESYTRINAQNLEKSAQNMIIEEYLFATNGVSCHRSERTGKGTKKNP